MARYLRMPVAAIGLALFLGTSSLPLAAATVGGNPTSVTVAKAAAPGPDRSTDRAAVTRLRIKVSGQRLSASTDVRVRGIKGKARGFRTTVRLTKKRLTVDAIKTLRAVPTGRYVIKAKPQSASGARAKSHKLKVRVRVGERGLAAVTYRLVGPSAPDPAPPDPAPEPPRGRAANFCTASVTRSASGRLEVGELDEVSGALLSRANAQTVWVHEDRGAGPILYALDYSGFERARFTLTGAQSYDWEDISFGPGPIAGLDYLYVADFGDNNQSRDNIVVHRVAEPTDIQAGSHDVGGVESFTFTYPNGAENAEALLIDPVSGDLVIIAKESGGTADIYVADAPLNAISPTLLQR